MQDERVKRELARIQINTPEDLAAWFVCDETQLAPAIVGAVINTDDNMRVETRAPREAFLPMMDANSAWIESLARKARMKDELKAVRCQLSPSPDLTVKPRAASRPARTTDD
jgi:hypothetical protein